LSYCGFPLNQGNDGGEGQGRLLQGKKRDHLNGFGIRKISLAAYDRLIGLELADLVVDCCTTKA
jgi:hypothetical protein